MFKSKTKNVQLLQHFRLSAAKLLKINELCKLFRNFLLFYSATFGIRQSDAMIIEEFYGNNFWIIVDNFGLKE